MASFIVVIHLGLSCDNPLEVVAQRALALLITIRCLSEPFLRMGVQN